VKTSAYLPLVLSIAANRHRAAALRSWSRATPPACSNRSNSLERGSLGHRRAATSRSRPCRHAAARAPQPSPRPIEADPCHPRNASEPSSRHPKPAAPRPARQSAPSRAAPNQPAPTIPPPSLPYATRPSARPSRPPPLESSSTSILSDRSTARPPATATPVGTAVIAGNTYTDNSVKDSFNDSSNHSVHDSGNTFVDASTHDSNNDNSHHTYTNSFTAHWCGYKGGDIPAGHLSAGFMLDLDRNVLSPHSGGMHDQSQLGRHGVRPLTRPLHRAIAAVIRGL